MYIKVFESRQSRRSYLIRHETSLRGLDHGKMFIENESRKIIALEEDELFKLIDTFFRAHLK